ncbi:MAG: DNA polymerase III subunit beta, partial [Firmicutes bacterium]|nr:DNA polymerase III subunit beta [Bacillota bacterium]
MNFTCEQVSLTKALNTVSKAVSSRTTIPTLKGILMDLKENTLTLTASDMDLTIETTIEVEGGENGSIVIPAKLFNEIIRKMPHDNINISTNGLNIDINCLTSNSSLIGSDADEFPFMKNPEENAKEIILNRNIFSNMIKKTSFAASIDQTKGAITGVLVEVFKDKLKMVAIDGFRMAVTSEEISSDKEENIIISARIMDEINKIIT